MSYKNQLRAWINVMQALMYRAVQARRRAYCCSNNAWNPLELNTSFHENANFIKLRVHFDKQWWEFLIIPHSLLDQWTFSSDSPLLRSAAAAKGEAARLWPQCSVRYTENGPFFSLFLYTSQVYSPLTNWKANGERL